MVAKGEGFGGAMEWEVGVSRCKLLCIPDYILEGLVTAYKSYLAQEEMLSTSTQPAAPRVTQRKAMPQSQWPRGGSYGENNYGAGSFGGGFGHNKKDPFGNF